MTHKEGRVDHEAVRRKEVLTNAIIGGLIATYDLHERLGDAGKSAVQQNPFGETALAMDVRAEEAVLDGLRQTGISMQIFAEEHGKFSIGNTPDYTVALDGLDGSAQYKEKRGVGMYGTMVSVLEGPEPQYEDYLVNGIMIHSPIPQLILAIKGHGLFTVDVKSGERKPIQKRETKMFSESSRIDLDIMWPPYKTIYESFGSTFPNMACRFLSGAARTALFVRGEIDVALEWTRKGNLEQAVNYGLVREQGGVMTTADGGDLGNKSFRTFGQEKHISLIIARNQRTANQISQRFSLDNIG